jgi:catechol O-methyltransferase
MFEVWDPLPFWWLYHVYWPAVFWGRACGGGSGRWSRVNVSTGKVFEM